MANSLSFTPLCSLKTHNQPGLTIGNSTSGIGKIVRVNELIQSSRSMRFPLFEVKATQGSNKDNPNKSILCPDCGGNGAVNCSQCKGTGANLIDHFDGHYKVGEQCWLCSGRSHMLCGNCNGAGFLGGFMSTKDE